MSFPDLAAGAILAAAGIGAWRYYRARSGDVGPEPPATEAPPGPDGDEVSGILRRLAPWLDATRLIVWERDDDADGDATLRPLHSSGALPAPVPAAGEPLAWALENGQPLRLDGTPGWARGPTTAAPAGDGRLLTVEADAAAPSQSAVAEAAALIAPVLALRERERRAVALSERFDRFVAFLGTLPTGELAERFSADLARVVAEMAEADGALVASCADRDGGEGGGQVLASWGTGGPVEGTYFGIGDGDLATAARLGEIVRRDPSGRMPALAQPGEKWRIAPRYRVAVPLVDASGEPRGVVAFWGATPASDLAIEMLRGLAPLLALQLQHSTDVVRFRAAAHEDALTGLANRAGLETKLVELSQLFDRYRRPLSLMVIDLDHFKHINDTWGHPAGDAVLQRVAETVKGAIRDVDFPARFGGEELVVLLPETMRREAGEVAERVRAAIERAEIQWNGRRIPVTASIGVSSCTETVDVPGLLLKSADAALYASKEGGRNRVTVAVPDSA